MHGGSRSKTGDERQALKLVDADLPEDDTGRKALQVVITGKGPNKAAFEASVAATPFKALAVNTAWLSAEVNSQLKYFSITAEFLRTTA